MKENSQKSNSQNSNSGESKPSTFFNVNTTSPHTEFTQAQMGQFSSLLDTFIQPLRTQLANDMSEMRQRTDELKSDIVHVWSEMDKREYVLDTKVKEMNYQQRSFESTIAQELVDLKRQLQDGNRLARRANNRILWLRGYPTDNNGRPRNLYPMRNVLPSAFFEWVQGVTKVGNDSFRLNIKDGVDCTYYKLGVLMAKYDAQFRQVMSDFDTRTKKEIADGVGQRDSRYYREVRDLHELDEVAVNFVQDAADGNEGPNTNFM